MAFDDKTQPNPGNGQQNQGGPDRNNPNAPSGVTTVQGQAEGNSGNKPQDQELDEQGRATGHMSNQKESNRLTGTTSSANSGNRDSTGSTSGPKL